MVSKETLIELLPLRDQVVLTEDRQNTSDIRREILSAHRDYAADYDRISHYFDTGNVVDTTRDIFDFLKHNVPYKKENGSYQTVKSPAAILTSNSGRGMLDRIDCKNYASFICGVLDSIKRNNGGDWDWCYRFASYDENDPEPGHVFAVVKVNGRELWVDPVFPYFNGGTMHEWEIDQKPAKGKSIAGLYRISGPESGTSETVVVNTQDAARNWLVAVQFNLFALPTLLLSYPQITNSPAVLKALTESGVDLNALNAILAYLISQQ